MKHNLHISIRKTPSGNGIVYCRKLSLRERLMDLLLGEKKRVTVIVPGDFVESVSIQEISEGSECHEQDG